MEPARRLRRLEGLRVHEATIGAALTALVLVDDMPGKKSCRVEVVLAAANIDDEGSWPEHRAWMLDLLARLRAVVADVGRITD